MEPELEKLGLERDEAKVYVSLLDLGDTTAGPVVKATRLHRQTVYNTIEKLKQKDLVSETVVKNRKHWAAASPTRILDAIQRKESIAEKLLPELLARQTTSEKKQEVRVFEGGDSLVAAQLDAYKRQPKGSEIFILGATPRYWIETMKNARRMKTHERVRRERKISMKLLFSESMREETQELVARHVTKRPEEHLRNYRYLPAEYLFPTLMQVWEHHVSLYMFGNPLLFVELRNKEMTDSFRTYFELLWKMGKK